MAEHISYSFDALIESFMEAQKDVLAVLGDWQSFINTSTPKDVTFNVSTGSGTTTTVPNLAKIIKTIQDNRIGEKSIETKHIKSGAIDSRTVDSYDIMHRVSTLNAGGATRWLRIARVTMPGYKIPSEHKTSGGFHAFSCDLEVHVVGAIQIAHLHVGVVIRSKCGWSNDGTGSSGDQPPSGADVGMYCTCSARKSAMGSVYGSYAAAYAVVQQEVPSSATPTSGIYDIWLRVPAYTYARVYTAGSYSMDRAAWNDANSGSGEEMASVDSNPPSYVATSNWHQTDATVLD